jgi:hypothetical protein
VAVAVAANPGDVRQRRERRLDPRQHLPGHRRISRAQSIGDEIRGDQFDAVVAAAVGVEALAVPERPHRPGTVDPPQGSPQGDQGIGAVELRRPTATARKQREAKALVVAQCGPIRSGQRSDYRELQRRQLDAEIMLLGDLGVAPAPGAVELGDQGFAVLDADLIDPVFVAVERGEAAVAGEALGFHRREQRIRGQHGEGVSVGLSHDAGSERWEQQGNSSGARCAHRARHQGRRRSLCQINPGACLDHPGCGN